jgi:hypothetical protein
VHRLASPLQLVLLLPLLVSDVLLLLALYSSEPVYVVLVCVVLICGSSLYAMPGGQCTSSTETSVCNEPPL